MTNMQELTSSVEKRKSPTLPVCAFTYAQHANAADVFEHDWYSSPGSESVSMVIFG